MGITTEYRQDCGCRMRIKDYGMKWDKCPLHAAAERMQSCLTSMRSFFVGYIHSDWIDEIDAVLPKEDE